MTTISITRALATIKATNLLIDQFWTTPRQLIGVQVGKSGKETSIDNADATAATKIYQSTYDSITGMIDKVTKLRNAINASNHSTVVEVNGVKMTVAEAIILKNSIPHKEKFLAQMRKTYQLACAEVARIKVDFEKRVDSVAGATAPVGATAEVLQQHLESTRKIQEDIVGPILLDPLKIADKVAALEKEINFVKIELDYTLSTSNTLTMIDVAL